VNDCRILLGDCAQVLPSMEADSIDAIVTDPPAGIAFMGQDWDKDRGGRDSWIAWMSGVAAECLRVAKPGAHALVWAIPRTSHWTATAWENAGWEVRDRIGHLFGTGFPKSLNVSLAIDKAAGAQREVIGRRTDRAATPKQKINGGKYIGGENGRADCSAITAPATDAAKQWSGWGTALKPACEDWWLLRKPLAGTVAENLSRFGTGGINIDACRIEAPDGVPLFGLGKRDAVSSYSNGLGCDRRRTGEIDKTTGRWPANVTHDGSDEVLAVFPERAGQLGPPSRIHSDSAVAIGKFHSGGNMARRGDSGSAARFFFCSKASRADREEGLDEFEAKQMDESRDEDAPGANNPRNRGGEGRKNHHPTVKSTRLMRWLVKLVTPPNGTVLDPFAGSGSTGKACVLERRGFIGIEQDPEFVAIAEARTDWARKHLRRAGEEAQP